VKFVFIAAEKALYPVRLLCLVLEVSRSGYYAWGHRPHLAQGDRRTPKLVVEIRAAFGAGVAEAYG